MKLLTTLRQQALVVWLLVLLTAAACSTTDVTPEPVDINESSGDEAEGITLTLGDIDEDDPIAKIREFQPLADYLAANLSDLNVSAGHVEITPDLASMVRAVNDGTVDIYYDSLYPAMIIAEETGAEPLLRGWRGGEPVYHSVFFAMADSGITSLDDLVGRSVAYDDPASTSGYMMPTSYMISNGLNPVVLDSAGAPVADDTVGYVFSGDDENTIEWVISGRVDAGVVDNLIFNNDIPEATREQMVVIAQTIDVPRRVLMISPHVEPEIAARIKELFEELDSTEEGQELLETLRTAQFDEFPGGVEEAFAPIREMYTVLVAFESGEAP